MPVLKGRPFIGCNLYLDDVTYHIARKNFTFRDVAFTARVLSYGTIERSIPYPAGQLEVDNTEVLLEDIDGVVRAEIDGITPIRRLAEIFLDFEGNAGSQQAIRNSPIRPVGDMATGRNSPIPDPLWNPLFTGSIVGVTGGPGTAKITVKEVVATWEDRLIPKLITRDNFPNLPDDANETAENYTAPIIFGRVLSFNRLNIENQGVIRCWEVDTTRHWYCVARHTCFSVAAVYRKRQHDHKFILVSPTEYTIVTHQQTINNILYTFTMIQFTAKQPDGTVIHADVSGINFHYNFTTGETDTDFEARNPVDAVSNLVLFMQDEVNPINWDGDSFVETYNRCRDKGYLCDGAITEQLTNGQAISRVCGDFGIDFYQNNQAKLAVKLYDPYTPGGDTVIPVDSNLTLLKTVQPKTPDEDHLFNRLRYRYLRQNAGLTEYVLRSATSQWGDEQFLDNATDQDELSNTGENPLLENTVELHFVRDPDVALALMKVRMGYYTLRSYTVEFEVPAPEVAGYIGLVTPLSMTHRDGIGPGGWTDLILKVYGITFDLHTYRATVRAVRLVQIPDGDFVSSWTGSYPAHDANQRLPHLPTYVNGSLSGGVTDPAADPSINLNDTTPAAPDDTSDAPATYTYSFTDGSTVTVPRSSVAFTNVKWQEDRSGGIGVPRPTSAYVPLLGGRDNVRFFIGTLSPDTRPALTDSDIGKAIFYSTDFDHEYLYVGTGETGTPSGWVAMDQTAGNIVMRSFSPTGPGWHICDGSMGVNCSTYDGSVETIDLPDFSGGAFPKLANAYDGPAPTNAVAPGATSGSAGAHTHPGSSVASHTHSFSAAPHAHTADVTVTDIGHSHTVSISSSGSTGSAGAHDHSGATNGGVDDGSHEHTGATGPHADTGFEDDHTHGIPAGNTGGSSGHTHPVDITGTFAGNIGSASVLVALADLEGAFVSTEGDTVSGSGEATGNTGGETGHTHPVGGVDTGPTEGEIVVPAGTFDIDVPSTGSDHHHGISSDGSHTHSFSVSTDPSTSTDNANVSVGVSIEATTVTGTTGSASPSLTITTDGSHTHTVTVDATGEPKKMQVLAYMRL